jgi:hypothetical protein
MLPPSSFILSAYPNPFNPATRLSFTLPRAGHVTLTIYDLTGRAVTTLADEVMTAGNHDMTFDGSHLASGLYIAALKAGTQHTAQKIVLLR